MKALYVYVYQYSDTILQIQGNNQSLLFYLRYLQVPNKQVNEHYCVSLHRVLYNFSLSKYFIYYEQSGYRLATADSNPSSAHLTAAALVSKRAGSVRRRRIIGQPAFWHARAILRHRWGITLYDQK